jgi:hypothetical protein
MSRIKNPSYLASTSGRCRRAVINKYAAEVDFKGAVRMIKLN